MFPIYYIILFANKLIVLFSQSTESTISILDFEPFKLLSNSKFFLLLSSLETNRRLVDRLEWNNTRKRKKKHIDRYNKNCNNNHRNRTFSSLSLSSLWNSTFTVRNTYTYIHIYIYIHLFRDISFSIARTLSNFWNRLPLPRHHASRPTLHRRWQKEGW